MAYSPHTGRIDCCIICMTDVLWQAMDDRHNRRKRVKAERSRELSDMWRDYGGEA